MRLESHAGIPREIKFAKPRRGIMGMGWSSARTQREQAFIKQSLRELLISTKLAGESSTEVPAGGGGFSSRRRTCRIIDLAGPAGNSRRNIVDLDPGDGNASLVKGASCPKVNARRQVHTRRPIMGIILLPPRRTIPGTAGRNMTDDLMARFRGRTRRSGSDLTDRRSRQQQQSALDGLIRSDGRRKR